MAIHPACPGLEVSIRANSQNLEEHPDPAAKYEPGVVTRYVLANNGLIFHLRLGLSVPLPSNQSVRMLVYFDGTLVSTSLFTKEKIERRTWYYFKGKRYHEENQWYHRRYQFADIIMSM